MNILYQKSKLLGRPFRTAEDEWMGQLTGDDWSTLLGTDWQYAGAGSDAEQNAINFAQSSLIDPSILAQEERDALNKTLASSNLKLSDIPKELWSTVKGFFTKPDGSTDWAKLGAGAGAIMGLTGIGKAQPKG